MLQYVVLPRMEYIIFTMFNSQVDIRYMLERMNIFLDMTKMIILFIIMIAN